MIKPLANVSVSVLGNEVAIADGDKNGGKTAYGQLLAGEDVSVTDESRTLFIPYHAVEYAVIERSSETVEDPEDALCKPEEGGGGVLGLWQFNETINLAPMGTEWNVTWTAVGVNGESIKFDISSQQGMPQGDSFQLCSSTIGTCLPVYVDGVGWTSGSPLAIEFTGGDDIENPDFVAWLNANATPYTPPTVSGCWKFKDSPSYEAHANAPTSFTSNGQTWDGITINGEIQFSRNGESIVVYGYSTETYQDEWTDEAYKDICFTGEAEVSDGFYAWLAVNATKVS